MHYSDKLMIFFPFSQNILQLCSTRNNTDGRILKANLSWTRQKTNSSDAKKNFAYLRLSFLHLKPDFRYPSLSFVRSVGVASHISLQLTGRISLKLDSNSCLLLEYGRETGSYYPTSFWEMGVWRHFNSTLLKR